MAKKSLQKKKKKGIDLMDIALGVGIGYGIYSLFFSGTPSNKRSLSQSEIDLIFMDKLGKPSNQNYDPFFNESWAMALKNGSAVFNIAGQNYSSLTGKIV